jgi:hypothetical protein
MVPISRHMVATQVSSQKSDIYVVLKKEAYDVGRDRGLKNTNSVQDEKKNYRPPLCPLYID